ncbi:LytTR family DNA-binding domain-containing protein [Ferruginibacter lapsinanis]|uniref:LytR/AlgR family response regulator transcription factor n=1 Tax=Ferruginibacter lapsinanis TaxID=563172 RepID=UPI001E3499DF|nr:LytTR family DNA-binding domain-containing protein [Ferruginibacter lapsinanis]UEG48985.1 LytTR family DNA-binding domain-containing protein [Ferruginibacter lapsinanis]
MNKIKAVVIDDEPGNIITLTEMLHSYCPDIDILGSAENIHKGETLIKKTEPHLVFLDIEMPMGNAFDLLAKLTPVTFEVIFITAFNNYAIQAFKYSAIDYLLKPVNIDELIVAVAKVKRRLEEKQINLRIESLMDNFKTESPALKKIGLPFANGLIFEETENIMHFEAEGSYTNVYIKGKCKELITKSLKEFGEILPTDIFFRVHHSHIVNLNYIKKYYKGRGGYIELEDGTTVEVSARKKDEFLERFKY